MPLYGVDEHAAMLIGAGGYMARMARDAPLIIDAQRALLLLRYVDARCRVVV